MTYIDNLPNIIKSGLLCKNSLLSENFSYCDIANNDVQDKRAKVVVPVKKDTNLHDYVPFYFSGKTPMLYVQGQKQSDIIFLATNTDEIKKSGIFFTFTDRHAVIQYARFYTDLADLNKLDLKAIQNSEWGFGGQPMDAREKKQAEFLVCKKLPFTCIPWIGVQNKIILEKVNFMLENSNHKPIVKIKSEWYFI